MEMGISATGTLANSQSALLHVRQYLEDRKLLDEHSLDRVYPSGTNCTFASGSLMASAYTGVVHGSDAY